MLYWHHMTRQIIIHYQAGFLSQSHCVSILHLAWYDVVIVFHLVVVVNLPSQQ